MKLSPKNLSPLARGRLFLVTVIALFLVPLLVAWLLVGRWQPVGHANHGALLDPARPVAPFQAHTLSGEPLGTQALRGRWSLLYVTPDAACDQRCRDALYQMRQVRLALGRDTNRTQTLLLLPQVPDARVRDWLGREHDSTTAAVAGPGTRAFFGAAFSGVRDGIYLTDPLGNLVLRYDPEDDPQGMLKDLKRLLKLSRIG